MINCPALGRRAGLVGSLARRPSTPGGFPRVSEKILYPPSPGGAGRPFRDDGSSRSRARSAAGAGSSLLLPGRRAAASIPGLCPFLLADDDALQPRSTKKLRLLF